MNGTKEPRGGPSPDRQSLSTSPTGPGGDSQPPKKGAVRKRTKTGCLTCRKRRIKCDEGKPTCNNCIKSKRQCEGYNTRVVFKEPLGTFQNGTFGPGFYRPGPSDTARNSHLSSNPAKSSPQGPLPTIAPKPPSQDLGVVASYPYAQAYQSPPQPASSASAHSAHGLYASHHAPHHAPQHVPFLPPQSAARHQEDPFAIQSVSHHPHEPMPGRVPLPARRQSAHARMEPPERPFHWTHPDDIYIYSAREAPPPGDEDYWYSDDDASMAPSDDEEVGGSDEAHLQSNDLGVMVAQKLHTPYDLFGTQMRSFHAFSEDNILAAYIPSSTNSPLTDSQTAAIFWYFVNVTGPSMSLYERHPFDPSPLFQGQPVPKTRQHIWTYVFPIIALNHPALLQAMLALGSLQMAKLQGIPAVASMKHYHLSLRRIAKNYSSATRRTQPATLAATLLLGFYEVWNSDHDKWCKHLWGARAVLREIPLRWLTASILALKRNRHQYPEQPRHQHEHGDSSLDQGGSVNDMELVDLDLVSQLSGQSVSYDEDPGRRVPRNRFTARDLEDYEQVADLYWWYCKMDIYQSFLGGTPLFMDYEAWSQCIPRAPLGRIDAIYGTFDHLVVLLGRLASFAAKDLARKRKARKHESSSGGPGGPGGPGQGNSPPMFVGMLPARGQFTIPPGLSPPRDPSPQSEGSEEMDLDASTAAALGEWEAIRRAFDLFRAHLGPDFEPMGPEYEPPRPSPFGPAQTYRTYSIACIWMNYYMGLIALYRAHPSMPPFAMVAAGMAARNTATYALELGRISAGLAEDSSAAASVSTLVGAAFIESCFPVFVAAVQYQDQAQRHWTIRRLHDTARLTGWQSARQIANGCEAAWLKAAALGRGPPYERDPSLDVRTRESVWANPRRIDARIRELASDEGKRVVLARSEQAHYALGLLGVEQDLEKLDLRDGG